MVGLLPGGKESDTCGDGLSENQVFPRHAGEFENHWGAAVKLNLAAHNVGEAYEGFFVEIAFVNGLDDIASFAKCCGFFFHNDLRTR